MKWEVRVCPRQGSSKGFNRLPPKPPAPESRDKVQTKPRRMSDNMWTADSSPNSYNDYCPDDGGFEDRVVRGVGMDPLRKDNDRDFELDVQDLEQLELAIAKKELQLLTKRRVLQRRQAVNRGSTSTMDDLDDRGMLRSNRSDHRAMGRHSLKQQEFEVRGRKNPEKKHYAVDIDMKGHPCGQNRLLWLICL